MHSPLPPLGKTPPPPAHPAWAYFLDLDGTLIDIAPTPAGIVVDRGILDLLAALRQACGGALALISGRSLADLDRHLDGLALPAAGLHGLERRGLDGVVRRAAAQPPAWATLRDCLRRLVAAHPGLLLEDKGLAFALHYRQAPNLAGYVHRWVGALLAAHGQGMQMQRGKRVVEIRPSGADKGSAIAEFLARPPFHGRRPVCVGDDLTDEFGFALVNRLHGVSVKVGRGPTCARYRLPDVAAVRDWLVKAATASTAGSSGAEHAQS